MKKLSVLIAVMLLMIPTVAMAAYFLADENVPKGDVIMGNLYLAGGNPTMDGDVQGDLYMSGGNVTITGRVLKDLVVAGGNVSITGQVDDDVRVFGGQIYLDGKVNGEVIAFGGDVRLGPNASVRKDLVAGGGTVNVDENAKIFGTQKIYTDTSEGIAEKKAEWEKYASAGTWFGIVFTILGYLVLASVLMGLFPNVVNRYLTNATKKGSFWKQLGLGLLVLITAPIFAVIAMFTGIGAMLGVVVLFMYIIYIIVNLALAGVLFGSLMQKWIMKAKKVQMDWVWGLSGIAVLTLLTLVPVAGFILGAVFFLYSMGAVLTTDWKVMKQVK